MKTIKLLSENDLLKLAEDCDAIYMCPKNGSKRLGPLVVYAGKDTQGRNLVGDIYINFRKLEERPALVEQFAIVACQKLSEQGLLDSFDTVCGIPQGGRTFGQMLAFVANKRFTYPEKKPVLTVVGQKQEYAWDLSQFDFAPGERVAIAEDVFNNFQNTDHTLSEVVATGAEVVLLAGAFNRSPFYDTHYIPTRGLFSGQELPIIASVMRSYPEYSQDDLSVIDDVKAGNVEYAVKANWQQLMRIHSRAKE